MMALIDAAFSRSRVVAMVLAVVLALGAYAYVAIPKEANPEVPLPFFYVSTGLDGISPGDSERLLIEPMEQEFGAITGLERMESFASEGSARVALEFTPGGDTEEALRDIRAAVDRIEGELPDDAYDLTVTEINTALFPVVTAILSGPVPERTLNAMAEDLQTAVEGLPGVLEVDIGGRRVEFMEVLIDPTVFQTYDLSFDELIGQITRNNRLIAAGAIETGPGRIVLTVPGLIETLEDVMEMPVLVRDGTVVTFGDVATVRRAFDDPTGFARIDGQPALALEITKRSGANIIETVAEVREVAAELQAEWPEAVQITWLQDQSEIVEDILSDLEANVIAAIVLVMIVVVYALGLRSAILVGLAIPGAFLAGVTGLWAMGYTMNIIVLFSLILVVGMLVDGAIVTTELADHHLQNGAPPREAFAAAAKRMAWPIIASTATTLSVFFPLLFWTGMVGEFMKFLPITVILTLSASLFMALVFIPVLGGIIGRRQPRTAAAKAAMRASESGDPRELGGLTGAYIRLLEFAILRPAATVILTVGLLLGSCLGHRGHRRSGPDRDRRPHGGQARQPPDHRAQRGNPERSRGDGARSHGRDRRLHRRHRHAAASRCRGFGHRRPGRGGPLRRRRQSPGSGAPTPDAGDHGRRLPARRRRGPARYPHPLSLRGTLALRARKSQGADLHGSRPDLQLRHLRADREARHGPACR